MQKLHRTQRASLRGNHVRVIVTHINMISEGHCNQSLTLHGYGLVKVSWEMSGEDG